MLRLGFFFFFWPTAYRSSRKTQKLQFHEDRLVMRPSSQVAVKQVICQEKGPDLRTGDKPQDGDVPATSEVVSFYMGKSPETMQNASEKRHNTETHHALGAARVGRSQDIYLLPMVTKHGDGGLAEVKKSGPVPSWIYTPTLVKTKPMWATFGATLRQSYNLLRWRQGFGYGTYLTSVSSKSTSSINVSKMSRLSCMIITQ